MGKRKCLWKKLTQNKTGVFSLKLDVLMVFSFLFIVLTSVSSLAALNVALSDQGTGVSYNNGTTLSSGDLTVLIYDALTGGNLIYNETFSNAISNGSWNVMIGENINLPLEFGKIYYKDYLIAGEDASFVNGSGASVGRQFFYSPLGDINTSDLVNSAITTVKLERNINLSNATGYLYDNLVNVPSTSGEQWNITTSNYLINQSGILYINETKLNATIDNRISSQGINASFNQTLTDTLYLPNGTNVDIGDKNITTTGSGFFGFLGSLASRITKLFVQDVDFNGTITGKGLNASNNSVTTITISSSTGNVNTSGNVTANKFIGDGSQLTDIVASISADSINGTELADTITLDAAMNIIDNDFAVNTSDLFVDVSTGNVGIGTSSPSTTLEVSGNTTIVGNLNVTGTSYLSDITINADNITVNNILSRDGNISFYNSTGSEKVRITADGNVGIGTTSPGQKLVVAGNVNITGDLVVDDDGGVIIGHIAQITAESQLAEFQVLGTGAGDTRMTLGRWSADANYPVFQFVKSRNAAIGSNTIVQDNDVIGGFFFIPDDGGDFNTRTAELRVVVDDASPAAGDIGTEFLWFQMPGGGGALAETMRLTAAGNLGIGTTSPTQKLVVVGDLNVTGTSYLGDITINADNITVNNILGKDSGSVLIGDNLFVNGSSVGIGTTNPTTELEVVGDITSKGTSWTSRTSAVDNQWYDVTYGDGLFVAVAINGSGDRVMTSPDGITWTNRSSAADITWTSVTYGNGLFVAVSQDGSGNRVMTSPNGITWTSRTSAADNPWQGVTYGNGLFVAVSQDGSGDRVMTSPDGITWTSRTSASENNWRSITFGDGLFVATAFTGTGNRVMTSPDGITWTNRTSASDNFWHHVTYGNGLFVAVSSDGTSPVMTSPDGINWTSRISAADINWQAVTYGNGLFVAVAGTGTGNRVMTSPDGITWTNRTSAADNNWIGIIYGNGIFVAVSSDGVMTSGKPEINVVPTNNIFQGGLDVRGDLNVTGLIYGNGSQLTDVQSSVGADSIDGTELADTLTLDAAMNIISNDFSVNTSDLFVDVSTGRVGIGTVSPAKKLHVTGADTEVAIGNGTTTYGTFRFNDGSQKLEFSNDNGTTFSEVGSGGGAVNGSGGAFYGSLNWEATTGCSGWSTNSSSFSNFSDVACDDNARTARGLTTSVVTAGDAEGSVPQIKFDSMPAGYYLVEARGYFQTSNAEGCVWRFTDGSSFTDSYVIGGGAGFSGGGILAGEFFYSADQGATTIQVQGRNQSTNTCSISAEGSDRDFQLVVYYFPSFGTEKNDTIFSDLDGDTRINVDANGGDSDNMTFFTAGGQRVVIDNSGNVGIGTAAPTNKLEIVGGGIYVNHTGGTKLSLDDSSGTARANHIVLRRLGSAIWTIGSDILSTDAQEFGIRDNEAGVTRFLIDNTGNVGIGTTSPSHTLTVNGDVNLNNSFYVNSSTGNVGIGTTSPEARLHVNSSDTLSLSDQNSFALKIEQANEDLTIGVNSTHAFIQSFDSNYLTLNAAGNEVLVGTASDSGPFTLQVNGDICESDTTLSACSSDLRLKENIVDIENAMGYLMSLRPRYFNFIGDSVNRAGLIAQEVNETHPELVTEAADGYYTWRNPGLDMITIKAIQEQQAQIEELKLQNDLLKQELCQKDNSYSWC